MPRSLALFLSTNAVVAHVCFSYPPQRGDFNVTTPGDPSCYRRTEYCGGVNVSAPKAAFVAGEMITVTLVQNLNHFFPPKVGFFDIAITSNLNPSAADFTTLTSWIDAPAFDMVDQTVFDVHVTLPTTVSAHSILRARYVSYNPLEVDPVTNTDAVFYNCADISIVGQQAKTEVLPHPKNAGVQIEGGAKRREPQTTTGTTGCTTPESWIANFTEMNAWGFVQHRVWWDSVNELTRWDKVGNIDASGVSSLSLINNYKTANGPVEWVNFVSQSKCYVYGPDAFYPWSYGSAMSMVLVGTENGVDTYEMDSPAATPFKWVTQDLGGGLCSPLAWSRGQASAVLTDIAVGPIDSSIFVPDASCKNAPVGGCRVPHPVRETAS